jgi:3-hydroxybutyryl-CoA dehydrogenase
MEMKIGVLGAGTMGAGIAQVAASHGNQVVVVDLEQRVLDRAQQQLVATLQRLVEKGKISPEKALDTQQNISYFTTINAFHECDLVIEAIVEKLDVKHRVFSELETVVSNDCVLASNTSSLSIASIGSALQHPHRVIGIHFFNPAPLMPLVEIIPAIQTSDTTLSTGVNLINKWGKVGVVCKDTPGFIVNRVARPFYGEALRIYEEGIADFATIDWAMTHFGKFKMGPFALMDYIGNDVNYAVTVSVFEAFYYDPRFKPSFTQRRHQEAGFYGRKTGRGFYDYAEKAVIPAPTEDVELGKMIVHRILVMLINEAIDAVFMHVASPNDIDLAMTTGVNYPKGLLQWANEMGLENVLETLENLFAEYGEDRYRPNPLLRKMVREGKRF